MNGWPWNAYVGQKVVCVGAEIERGPNGEDVPQDGVTYTIREIVPYSEHICLRLEEIVNAPKAYLWGGIPVIAEAIFGADDFRPVQTRDTSARVAEIKRLALGVRDEVRA